MTKRVVELGPVQETLLIPLYARAAESRKTRPILRDPKAVEIVDSLDFDFTPFAGAKRTLLGCCLRGLLYDDWVRAFLREHPNGTVVELGAGLNTRFERVDNGTARWIELDLPDSIALRRQFFAESERRTFASASVLDPDWITQVPAGPVLFVAEAVVMYLPIDGVRETFVRLADHFPDGKIAFDSIDSVMIAKSESDPAFQRVRGRFAWHIDDPRDIETWDSRFRLEDTATLGQVAERHRRTLPIPMLIAGKIYSILHPKTAKSYRLHLMRWAPSPAASEPGVAAIK